MSVLIAGAHSLWIVNRDWQKAAALASAIHAACPGCETRYGADLIVNTTSPGTSDADEVSLDLDGLSRSTVVTDIILNPRRTRLLQIAKAKGCRTLSTASMLDAQMALASAHMGI